MASSLLVHGDALVIIDGELSRVASVVVAVQPPQLAKGGEVALLVVETGDQVDAGCGDGGQDPAHGNNDRICHARGHDVPGPRTDVGVGRRAAALLQQRCLFVYISRIVHTAAIAEGILAGLVGGNGRYIVGGGGGESGGGSGGGARVCNRRMRFGGVRGGGGGGGGEIDVAKRVGTGGGGRRRRWGYYSGRNYVEGVHLPIAPKP